MQQEGANPHQGGEPPFSETGNIPLPAAESHGQLPPPPILPARHPRLFRDLRALVNAVLPEEELTRLLEAKRREYEQHFERLLQDLRQGRIRPADAIPALVQYSEFGIDVAADIEHRLRNPPDNQSVWLLAELGYEWGRLWPTLRDCFSKDDHRGDSEWEQWRDLLGYHNFEQIGAIISALEDVSENNCLAVARSLLELAEPTAVMEKLLTTLELRMKQAGDLDADGWRRRIVPLAGVTLAALRELNLPRRWDAFENVLRFYRLGCAAVHEGLVDLMLESYPVETADYLCKLVRGERSLGGSKEEIDERRLTALRDLAKCAVFCPARVQTQLLDLVGKRHHLDQRLVWLAASSLLDREIFPTPARPALAALMIERLEAKQSLNIAPLLGALTGALQSNEHRLLFKELLSHRYDPPDALVGAFAALHGRTVLVFSRRHSDWESGELQRVSLLRLVGQIGINRLLQWLAEPGRNLRENMRTVLNVALEKASDVQRERFFFRPLRHVLAASDGNNMRETLRGLVGL